MNLTKYETFLNDKKAEKRLFEEDIKFLQSDIAKRSDYLSALDEALDVLNVVGILVQEEFQEVVEILVTDALRFIFGDNHSFEIDSIIARNQPEVHMFIVIDGERFSPEDNELSGGQANVVSFALRVIMWAIQYDRTRPTLIFDEPFRCLHGTDNASSIKEMIQYLSKTLNLQFIIITQDEELTNAADISFLVRKEKGISKVEVLEKIKEYKDGV
jgi:DNA repair exonuclease SbcCD ATPase subunit